MATGLYNWGRQNFISGAFTPSTSFTAAATAGAISVMLIQTAVTGDTTHYQTPSVGPGGTSTDRFVSSIPVGCITVGAFGAAVPLTGIVFTPPGGGLANTGSVYAPNLTFASVSQVGALIVNAIVIWSVASTAAASVLIAFIDATGTGSPGLPVTPNGSSITLQWPTVAPGIFTL